jgi:hypothetical protein
MCLNCGCGQPNEDHGKAENITADDLQRAADANGQSLRESAQHIVETVGLIESPAGDPQAPTDGSRGAADERGAAAANEDPGLAQPAGPAGATAPAGRGTPASES